MIPLLLALLCSPCEASSTSRTQPISEIAAESAAVAVGIVVAARTEPADHGLRTRYTVVVVESLQGEPGEELTVVLPGGRWEGLVQRFHEVPLWSEGDEVVVCVPAHGPVRFQGLLTVADGELLDPLDRGEDLVPRTLDELARELRTPHR